MSVQKVDAKQHFTPTTVMKMERLLEINEQMKALETEKQAIVDHIKGQMQAGNITNASINGATIALSEGARRTVVASTKEQFIAELIALDKKHLIQYDIKPDLDSIFAEVSAGTLAEDLVQKYVKVTPVVTLRCN